MTSPINLNYAGVYLPLSGASTHWFSNGTAGSIPGTSGNDTLYGNGKSQVLAGGAGDDIYYIYGAEQVVEQPNQGTDTIIASWTNVLLPANVENLFMSGNYVAYGNAEDNVIVGNQSNQVIDGGLGNDVLTGGGGDDTFVFDASSGRDVITDFVPGEGSVVRLAGYANITSFSQVQQAMTQHGADVVLTLDAGDSITFRNTTIAEFKASDFLLGVNPAAKQLTFSEDFNSLSLSNGATGTWLPHFTYVSNPNSLSDRTLYHGEQEIYVDPTMAGQGSTPLGLNPFSISGGVLTITAAPTPSADLQALYDYKYTSGLLTTQKSFSQEYGYFEIDAKLPTAAGVWPCFWLLPSSGAWPPEIDVMESDGGGGVVTQTIHTGASNATSSVATNLMNTTSSFHTYGVLWDPQHITFFIDNVETAQFATPADMHQAMYMLLDLAVAPNAPASSFPASMMVDFIRAYSLANAPTDVVVAADSAGVSPTTYTVPSLASASVAKPFNIAAFNPGHGDLIDLSGVDAIPATSAVDPWTLVKSFDGHAGELELMQVDSHGDWELLGDTTGTGHASFEVTFHVTGALTSYADVAAHIIL